MARITALNGLRPAPGPPGNGKLDGENTIHFDGPRSAAALEVVVCGEPFAGTVSVYGSLDGATFDMQRPLCTFEVWAGDGIKHFEGEFTALKVVLANLAGGVDPTVTATIIDDG